MDMKTDIIIIGGGLVGMTAALALAAFGVRTVVID
ncbi:MAG: FAD-dependent monooxygenase, partial [Pacificimonas sp.]